MSTKQEVLWMIDNLCVTHTGFDTLALQNRIDDIYVGVREHRNLDVLREEFCHLQQDILTKQSEFNNNTVIEVLRKAGFEITKTTKDIITCAIDNYLDINVKTIDNLD